MNILTREQVCEQLGVTRQLLDQSIRPLMAQEGDAQAIGTGKRTTWVYDGNRIWYWRDYIRKRAALIELGVWNSKRPYSLADATALVDVGVYDGQLDHPAFVNTMNGGE
jgi:hypothetical protein